MTYYVCVAIGQADFMPDEQLYIQAETQSELIDAINTECQAFDLIFGEGGDGGQSADPYRYEFRPPYSPDVNNWSQRLRIAHDSDMVLDVIGMTESEFHKQDAI